MRWKVTVSGGPLDERAREALQRIGAEADERPGGAGFTALVEADDGASARHALERTLRDVGPYSAGAAERER